MTFSCNMNGSSIIIAFDGIYSLLFVLQKSERKLGKQIGDRRANGWNVLTGRKYFMQNISLKINALNGTALLG